MTRGNETDNTEGFFNMRGGFWKESRDRAQEEKDRTEIEGGQEAVGSDSNPKRKLSKD